MSQTDVDLQLKVWKDLAISKQILMGAATDALGLDAECSTDELRSALDKAIKRAKEADANIVIIRDQTDLELTEMKQQVASSLQAKQEAEEKVAEADKARETAERQLAVGRSENAEATKKVRADVADKNNKLKAISKALADTPENVVKKLKTLKKQKMDEAKLRTQTESKLQNTRKQLSKLEKDLKAEKEMTEKTPALVEQVRELHGLCKEANKKIKSLSEDKKDQVKIPKLDEELLESLEGTKDTEDTKASKASKAK